MARRHRDSTAGAHVSATPTQEHRPRAREGCSVSEAEQEADGGRNTRRRAEDEPDSEGHAGRRHARRKQSAQNDEVGSPCFALINVTLLMISLTRGMGFKPGEGLGRKKSPPPEADESKSAPLGTGLGFASSRTTSGSSTPRVDQPRTEPIRFELRERACGDRRFQRAELTIYLQAGPVWVYRRLNELNLSHLICFPASLPRSR